MTSVVVQMGHCFRRSGATGTRREQEFTGALGHLLTDRLRAVGHDVRLIGADDAVSASEVFVALHTDGSSNPARRGASVGYPDVAGSALAQLWKREHQEHGYPAGFLRDNYTAALAGYYGFRRTSAKHRFLAEHGTTTNADDEQWLFANLDACAAAHVEAIGALYAPPPPPAPLRPARFPMVDMPLLRRGAPERFHVKLAQSALSAHRLLTDAELDGLFGPGTERAVKAMQARRGLPVTGVVDDRTWLELHRWVGVGR